MAFNEINAIAKRLASSWHSSMSKECGRYLSEIDVYDAIIDLYFARGDNDPIFHEKHRGWLYKTILLDFRHGKDALDRSMSFDVLVKESGCGSVADALDWFLPRTHEVEETDPRADVYLNRLSFLQSDGYSAALATCLGLTDRQGRNIANDIRDEAIGEVLVEAARVAGIDMSQLAEMAERYGVKVDLFRKHKKSAISTSAAKKQELMAVDEALAA